MGRAGEGGGGASDRIKVGDLTTQVMHVTLLFALRGAMMRDGGRSYDEGWWEEL